MDRVHGPGPRSTGWSMDRVHGGGPWTWVHVLYTSCQARLSRLPETDIGPSRGKVCASLRSSVFFEGELRFYSKEQSLRSKLSFI